MCRLTPRVVLPDFRQDLALPSVVFEQWSRQGPDNEPT